MKMQGYNGSQLWDTAFAVQARARCLPLTALPRAPRLGCQLLRVPFSLSVRAGWAWWPEWAVDRASPLLSHAQAIVATDLAPEFGACLRAAHDYIERSQVVGRAALFAILCVHFLGRERRQRAPARPPRPAHPPTPHPPAGGGGGAAAAERVLPPHQQGRLALLHARPRLAHLRLQLRGAQGGAGAGAGALARGAAGGGKGGHPSLSRSPCLVAGPGRGAVTPRALPASPPTPPPPALPRRWTRRWWGPPSRPPASRTA